ncbi:MAG: hypothetical protein CMJ89_20705, partial [Planctomycetes bacterium]|nr:hypothetical protein [Planctomycetota bacterium]
RRITQPRRLLLRQRERIRMGPRQLRLRGRDHPTEPTCFSDEFTRTSGVRLPPILVRHRSPRVDF